MSVRMQKLHQTFGFTCQWPEILRPGRYHWVNFDFIALSVEYDKIAAHFEIEAALLGFRVRICIPTAATEQSRNLEKQYQAAQDGTAELVPIEEMLAHIKAATGVESVVIAKARPSDPAKKD
jgi:hypothetical protein